MVVDTVDDMNDLDRKLKDLRKVTGNMVVSPQQQDDEWIQTEIDTRRFITIDISNAYINDARNTGECLVKYLPYAYTDIENKGEHRQGLAWIRVTQNGIQIQMELME